MLRFWRRKPIGYLAVCAIIKDEARHLLEWIAYHRALGVERFYLYDNGSTDGTAELLAPLAEAGLVQVIPWPTHPGQIPAYNDFGRRFRRQWEWAAFIDCDEFINPHAFDSIPEWLRTMGDAAAVAVQWTNFGPDGHDEPPEGLQIAAFRRRLPDDNVVHGHVKSIVRMRHFKSCLDPHACAVDGTVVGADRAPVAWRNGSYALQTPRPQPEATLNHYYTRSRRDWHEKVARGRADMLDSPAAKRDPNWFALYERDATVPDDRIARFIPAAEAMLRELGGIATARPQGRSPSRVTSRGAVAAFAA